MTSGVHWMLKDLPLDSAGWVEQSDCVCVCERECQKLSRTLAALVDFVPATSTGQRTVGVAEIRVLPADLYFYSNVGLCFACLFAGSLPRAAVSALRADLCGMPAGLVVAESLCQAELCVSGFLGLSNAC